MVLLYYTNGSHKFLFKFLWMKCLKNEDVTDVRRIKRDKSSRLGIPKAPQVNISKDTQASKLGDARLASHLSSSTNIGIPQFLFCPHCLCPLCFCFSLRIMLVWDISSLIYRIALCASLKSFEYGFIECFVRFTYIFWAWILASLY